MNKKTAAAILAFLCMVLPDSGSSAERKSELAITYDPPRISVEAQGVKLGELLSEISLKVGFDLADYGVPDRNLTVSIKEATVEDVLRQLLRGENYGVVYRERDRAISKVLLLGSPVHAHEIYENQLARIETVPAQEGLAIFPAPPSHQPARPEQKRKNRDENAPSVEEILRAHAISGLTRSDTFLQNGASSGPQPSGNSTSAFPSAGASSLPPRPLADMNNSLAMTTRLAQQNLKALADGLATATNSLRNSPAKK